MVESYRLRKSVTNRNRSNIDKQKQNGVDHRFASVRNNFLRGKIVNLTLNPSAPLVWHGQNKKKIETKFYGISHRGEGFDGLCRYVNGSTSAVMSSWCSWHFVLSRRRRPPVCENWRIPKEFPFRSWKGEFRHRYDFIRNRWPGGSQFITPWNVVFIRNVDFKPDSTFHVPYTANSYSMLSYPQTTPYLRAPGTFIYGGFSSVKRLHFAASQVHKSTITNTYFIDRTVV